MLGLPNPEIKPTPYGTTGRRLALANWITSPENPLSTRVIVNRVWQKHFGKGLVGSANDFGFLGEEPSHPELLDWLATSFVQGVGNSKIFTVRSCLVTPMVRPPVVSPRRKKRQTIPKTVFSCFPPQRLSAEQIRDTMLAAGELKPKSGGSSVDGNSLSKHIRKENKFARPDPRRFRRPGGLASASRDSIRPPRSRPCSYATTHGPMRARAMARNSRHTKPLKSPLGNFRVRLCSPCISGGDRARPKLPPTVDGQAHQPGKRGITPKGSGGKTRPFGSFPKRNYPDFQRRQLGTGKQLDHRSDCPTQPHPPKRTRQHSAQSIGMEPSATSGLRVTSAKSATNHVTSSCSSPVRTSGETSYTG